MELVAHFNIELHQMEIAFPKGQLFERVYMCQAGGFEVEGIENISMQNEKSFYGLK